MIADINQHLGIPRPDTSPRGLISIILATYNEGENISDIIHAIFSSLPGLVEIIVVDDNSPDLTWKIAIDLGDPRVISLGHPEGLASVQGSPDGSRLYAFASVNPVTADAVEEIERAVKELRPGFPAGWPSVSVANWRIGGARTRASSTRPSRASAARRAACSPPASSAPPRAPRRDRGSP